VLLQAADLIKINLQLTEGIDAGYDWRTLSDAIARHQGKVEFYPGLHEKAAALLDSLIRYQPFSHKNNQTAVLAIYTLYRENGYEVDLPEADLLDYIQTAGSPGQAQLAVLLGRHADLKEGPD
jgi:prophage maintenance system killer protein